jgi:hypothetical protein
MRQHFLARNVEAWLSVLKIVRVRQCPTPSHLLPAKAGSAAQKNALWAELGALCFGRRLPAARARRQGKRYIVMV